MTEDSILKMNGIEQNTKLIQINKTVKIYYLDEHEMWKEISKLVRFTQLNMENSFHANCSYFETFFFSTLTK